MPVDPVKNQERVRKHDEGKKAKGYIRIAVWTQSSEVDRVRNYVKRRNKIALAEAQTEVA